MILTDVKNAIIKNLHTAFNDFEIYSSPTEQGVQAPCFFVTWKDTKEIQDFGKFYFRVYTFDIDYFPPLDGSYNDEEISESLFDVLEWIKIDDYPTRCISSSADELIQRTGKSPTLIHSKTSKRLSEISSSFNEPSRGGK